MRGIARAAPGEADPAAFLPVAYRDLDELDGFLEHLAREVHDPGYAALLGGCSATTRCAPRGGARRARAAGHHAYLGGLLEHTVAVATLAAEACQLHVRLNSDLLITAALVHDLGKTREFTYGAEIGAQRRGPAARPRRARARLLRERAARRARRRGAGSRCSHCVLTHHGPDRAPGAALRLARGARALPPQRARRGRQGRARARPAVGRSSRPVCPPVAGQTEPMPIELYVVLWPTTTARSAAVRGPRARPSRDAELVAAASRSAPCTTSEALRRAASSAATAELRRAPRRRARRGTGLVADPVFKTGRASQPGAWKVRFLRRLVGPAASSRRAIASSCGVAESGAWPAGRRADPPGRPAPRGCRVDWAGLTPQLERPADRGAARPSRRSRPTERAHGGFGGALTPSAHARRGGSSRRRQDDDAMASVVPPRGAHPARPTLAPGQRRCPTARAVRGPGPHADPRPSRCRARTASDLDLGAVVSSPTARASS